MKMKIKMKAAFHFASLFGLVVFLSLPSDSVEAARKKIKLYWLFILGYIQTHPPLLWSIQLQSRFSSNMLHLHLSLSLPMAVVYLGYQVLYDADLNVSVLPQVEKKIIKTFQMRTRPPFLQYYIFCLNQLLHFSLFNNFSQVTFWTTGLL